MKQYCTTCRCEVIPREVDGNGDETYQVCPYCFNDHCLTDHAPKHRHHHPRLQPLPERNFYSEWLHKAQQEERERLERENAAIDYYMQYADFNREQAEQGFFQLLTKHK